MIIVWQSVDGRYGIFWMPPQLQAGQLPVVECSNVWQFWEKKIDDDNHNWMQGWPIKNRFSSEYV